MSRWRKVLEFNNQSEHMVCDECYAFKISKISRARMRTSSSSDMLVEQFQRVVQYRRHLNSVWKDRSFIWQCMDQAYTAAQDKSQIPPFLMVIADGMDQAKWRLPRYPGLMPTHYLGNLPRPSVVVEGVWVVGFRLESRITNACRLQGPGTVVENGVRGGGGGETGQQTKIPSRWLLLGDGTTKY